MELLPGGFDFVVYRVDFRCGEPVVFRGQRNLVSSYLGPLDFGKIMLGEIRFYERLPDLPVPRPLYFEPDEAVLGFPYAFFTCLPGLPLSDLLPQAPKSLQRRVMREMGGLLGTIHRVALDQVGSLACESHQTWRDYIGQRLRRRLEPYLAEDLVAEDEIGLLVMRAASLELNRPLLLHMDFRSVNLLARMESDSLVITGIVDAANSLAGDPAFDLARLDEGVGPEFLVGYEGVMEGVDRESDGFLLYRLETAALLTRVYSGSPDGDGRLQRFLILKDALVKRLGQRSVNLVLMYYDRPHPLGKLRAGSNFPPQGEGILFSPLLI